MICAELSIFFGLKISEIVQCRRRGVHSNFRSNALAQAMNAKVLFERRGLSATRVAPVLFLCGVGCCDAEGADAVCTRKILADDQAAHSCAGGGLSVRTVKIIALRADFQCIQRVLIE